MRCNAKQTSKKTDRYNNGKFQRTFEKLQVQYGTHLICIYLHWKTKINNIYAH